MDFAPRLPALDDAAIGPDLAPIIAAWPYRLHRTLAHSPDSLKAWIPWGEHILRNNRLGPRRREIVILRIAANARCAYEWGLHAWVARQVGMSQADVAAVARGAGDPHWAAPVEAALIRAVDELMADHRVGDETWDALAAELAPDALVDLLYLAGQFMLVAWLLNGLRLPPEAGTEPLPDAA